LNLEAFKKIKERGAKVVITVDCGTNSVAEADFCRENGIDLIITDHHELTGEFPNSFAIINPKLFGKKDGDKYPYREMVGVGVAYKLVCGLFSRRDLHDHPEGYEKWFLDLVAIGTIADLHSLLGENRILVKYGLKVLAKTRWAGLSAIIKISGLDQKAPAKQFDTYAVGFVIAPRINSAGRIEHASIAFDLLVTDDTQEAMRIGYELEKLNTKRQALTESVMSEARIQLMENSGRKVLLAVGSDWPKGVVGLVAGKLVEEFSRPVLVLERGEIEATGSARSIRNFNLVEALGFSRDVLVKYGGHAAAAGFSLKVENIDIFYKNLLDYADKNLSDEDMAQTVDIEAELRPEEIAVKTFEALENFEPFGPGNPRPKFALLGAEIKEMNPVGAAQKHLQLSISSRGKILKCIAFNFGKAVSQYALGEKVDLVFELLYDTWNGYAHIKLKVVEMRKAS